MGKSYFVIEMEKQYAIALGQYEVAEHAVEPIVGLKALAEADARITAKKRALREKMDRISLQIRLQYDPEWEPGHIRPILERERHDRRGEIAKAAYKVLKQASGPMKTREIARAAAPLLGLVDPDEREMARVGSAVYTTMQRRLREGMVTCEGSPARWSIKRQKWRPQASAAYSNSPATSLSGTEGVRPEKAPSETVGRC
jgi:hypothetical protein